MAISSEPFERMRRTPALERLFGSMRNGKNWIIAHLLSIGLVSVLPFVGNNVCAGQTTGTGTINGTVTDSTGAVIARAQVTATQVATGLSRSTRTNSTGFYVLPALRAGTYVLLAESAGFASVQQENIVLDADSTKTVDFSTKVSSQSETIKVTTAPANIETSSGAIGDLISGNQISDLPLNGRNFTQLLTVGTGASSPQTGTRMGTGQEGNPLLSLNGGRINDNAFTFDGILAMDTGGNRGVNVFPPMEAIQEMQVHTSNYTAEIGSYGYGSVNIITRSGGSSYHGDLYEILANNVLDARNYFSTSVAPLLDNNFGYDLGGRVLPRAQGSIARKTFFFWSEGWDKRSGPELTSFTTAPQGTFTALVPTQAMRMGDFSALLPATQLYNPATGDAYRDNIVTNIDSNAIILMNTFIPLPNSKGASNFVVNPRSQTNWTEELIRVDSGVSANDSIMGRFAHDAWSQNQAIMRPDGSNAFPTLGGSIAKPGSNSVLQWTHLSGPRVVNQAEMGFSRNAITQVPDQSAQRPSSLTIPSIFGATSLNVIPSISLGGGYGGFAVTGLTENTNNVYTWRDDVTIQLGRHTLMAGANILRLQKFVRNPYVGQNGSFTFNGSATSQKNATGKGSATGDAFADFLTGYAFQYSEQANVLNGYYFADMYEGYATDNWRISPQLTLDLGLRDTVYQGAPVGGEKFGNLSDFVPSHYSAAQAPIIASNGQVEAGTGNPLNGIITPANQDGLHLPQSLQPARNNIGPRIGFAWTPGRSENTVVRGGYGIFYTWDNDTIQSTIKNPPFSTSALLNSAKGSPLTLESFAGTSTTSPAPALNVFDTRKLYPMIEQYSLTAAHQFPFSTTLSLSYIGNSARHLDQEPNINQPKPGSVPHGVNLNAARPYLGYSSITYDVRSASANYNSMQVDLRRRFHKDLQYGAAYTWSHAFGQQVGQNQYFNENGPTAYDRRQVLTINYLYSEPFFKNGTLAEKVLLAGWEMAGITTFQGGIPFTADLSADPAGVGSSPGSGVGDQSERPNQIARLVYRPRSVAAYFNKSAFLQQTTATFGNESYGAIRGPGLDLWQVNISKNATFEHLTVKFEGEFFNVFNHANFNGLGTTYGAATFGTITSALDPRQIKFKLKVSF